MSATLSARDRRALGRAAVVALAALAWVGGVRPLYALYRDTVHQLAYERHVLARERGLLAAVPRLERAASAGGDRLLAAGPRFLDGTTAGTASASLAGYLHALADSAGVVVRTLAPAAPSDAVGGPEPVTLRVEAGGDMDALVTLLRAIEGGSRLLRLDSLEIAAAGGDGDSAGGAPATPAADDEGPLVFRFTATGMMRGPARQRPSGRAPTAMVASGASR